MTDYEFTGELVLTECPLEISAYVLGVTSNLCREWQIVNFGIIHYGDLVTFTCLKYKLKVFLEQNRFFNSDKRIDQRIWAQRTEFWILSKPNCSESSYLLTPWCRVLLEKLTGLQLVKKFPAFHGNRRFINALTSVRHLPLSWAGPIQSTYPHPTSWGSVLILSTHLRLGLPSGLFPSDFPTKTIYTPSPHPCAPHSQPISFFSILSPAQYWVRSTNHLAPRYAISTIPPFPLPS